MAQTHTLIYTPMDMPTYRLKLPRGQFSKNCSDPLVCWGSGKHVPPFLGSPTAVQYIVFKA